MVVDIPAAFFNNQELRRAGTSLLHVQNFTGLEDLGTHPHIFLNVQTNDLNNSIFPQGSPLGQQAGNLLLRSPDLSCSQEDFLYFLIKLAEKGHKGS